MPVVAAKGEGACLEDNILAYCTYVQHWDPTFIGCDALTSAKGLFTNILPFSTSFIVPELLLKDTQECLQTFRMYIN